MNGIHVILLFDINHIVPVEKFKKISSNPPMSALGNLCYLPVKDNRTKRDKTIYEYAGDILLWREISVKI